MRAHTLYLAIVSVLLALAAVTLAAVTASAAPPRLNCTAANAMITAPAAGATLNGLVQVEGTASIGGAFSYYKLEFAPEGSSGYTVFGGQVRQQVTKGQLGVWDSASVPDGVYSLRLVVVDNTSNYCDNPEATVHNLRVNNSAPPTPTESPTPVETEAPPQVNVVPTPLPTIVIPGELTSGQAQATEAPTPSGTRTASSGSTSLLPSGLDFGGITSALGELFSGYVRAFIFGALAMAGIMVLIGVIFYVRRVL